MNVYAIGASRNIGYYSAIRLLEKGATVTFLLRSPSNFDTDKTIQRYVQSGKARLVKGDALVKEDVAHGWAVAQEGPSTQVDAVLFTLGAPSGSFSLTKGFVFKPEDLCTRSLRNVIVTLPPNLRSPASQPKFIAISSIGLTKVSHHNLPLLLKPLYGYLLRHAHEDKLGLERIAAYCAGWDWKDEEPSTNILPSDWIEEQGIVEKGGLNQLVIIRPALLTDGACKADSAPAGKLPYRVKEGDLGNGYTVSRKDVAHFIVEGVVADWEKWGGKCVSIAY